MTFETVAVWTAITALALVGALTGNWWLLGGAVIATLAWRYWPDEGSLSALAGATLAVVVALGVGIHTVLTGPAWSTVVALLGTLLATEGLRRVVLTYRDERGTA